MFLVACAKASSFVIDWLVHGDLECLKFFFLQRYTTTTELATGLLGTSPKTSLGLFVRPDMPISSILNIIV